MRKNVKNLANVLKILSAVILVVILLFLVIILLWRYHDYRKMKSLECGYMVDSCLNFQLDDVFYSVECQQDLTGYYYKSENTEKAYHIVTKNTKLVALFQDFRVYSSVDDPNRYILKGEDDLFEGSLYYSENIELPTPENNQIRQIYVSDSFPPDITDDISITDDAVIDSVIDCIRSGEDPFELLSGLNYDCENMLFVCIDYSDFPMYQLICNGLVPSNVCSLFSS